MCVLQLGGWIIIWVYNCLCGRFSARLKHEPLCTLQNLPGSNIQLHTAGSVGGQTTFSRKQAGKQLALRVSSDKQTVTVCTQGECYQPAIISRQEFFLPKDLPKHASIRSSNWFRFLSVSREERVVKLRKCHSVYRQMLTCILLLQSLTAFCSRPAAVPMTCCPSCPSWLCSASVLSWCLNVPPWKSSFMKGESSKQKNNGWFLQATQILEDFPHSHAEELHSRFRILRRLKWRRIPM